MDGKYCSTEEELLQYRLSLKWGACPSCGRTGNLIGHGFLMGYSAVGPERIIRGRRFFCSNRFRKTGCGRTFSVLLADMLRGFMVSASILWQFLQGIATGISANAAWRSTAKGFCSENGYRILGHISRSQSFVRTRLCSIRPPPESTSTNPLLQLTAHFQTCFPLASCPVSQFQIHFQESLLR